MRFKPIAAIVVLLLMVSLISVAGCTSSSPTPTPTAKATVTVTATPKATTTPTSSTATHDSFLEKYLAAEKTVQDSRSSERIDVWDVTWINSTSARLEYIVHNKTMSNIGMSGNMTYIAFPTTQDATKYLNAMNKTGYSLASTVWESSGLYEKVTGHAPQIYKEYEWKEGFSIQHRIYQTDNLIVVNTAKLV
jgi:hypothetical protein